MSNKIKLNKKKERYTPIKRPSKISFQQYIADIAGCGHIRVIYPSLLLNTYYNPKERLMFESFYSTKYNTDPAYYNDVSFTIFQRSVTKNQLNVIKHFKKYNKHKPIIYEIDDNLFNIPEWNHASAYYSDLKPYAEEIISLCDGVVTSTQTLRKSLLKYNNNIKVIPNHLPKFLWGDSSFKKQNSDKIRVCYPGSFNHFDKNTDKGDFSKELIDFISDTLDEFQWVFVGGMPQSLKDNPKIEQYGWQSVLEYPYFLKNLNIDVMLAPLDNIFFNECKSNIKALDATAIGVPLICSNIEPYNNLPGICNTSNDMIQMINDMTDESNRYDIYTKQYNILKKQLYWEDDGNLLKYVNTFLNLVNRKL